MMNEMYGMFTILSQLTADSAIGFCKLSHSFNKSKNVQRILALICKNQWLIHWDKQKRIYGKITLYTYSNIFAFVLFCLSWIWIQIAVISQAVQRTSSPTANSFPLFASTFVSIILLHKLKFWIKYRGCWECRNHIKKRKRKGVHNLTRWVPLKQSPILEHNLSGCTYRPGKKSVRHIYLLTLALKRLSEQTDPWYQEIPHQIPILRNNSFTFDALESFYSNGTVDFSDDSLKLMSLLQWQHKNLNKEKIYF